MMAKLSAAVAAGVLMALVSFDANAIPRSPFRLEQPSGGPKSQAAAVPVGIAVLRRLPAELGPR